MDSRWALRPPTTDLLLTFKVHAFVASQRPSFKQTLCVKNSEVAVSALHRTISIECFQANLSTPSYKAERSSRCSTCDSRT
jgi:hypothetical protein